MKFEYEVHSNGVSVTTHTSKREAQVETRRRLREEGPDVDVYAFTHIKATDFVKTKRRSKRKKKA